MGLPGCFPRRLLISQCRRWPPKVAPTHRLQGRADLPEHVCVDPAAAGGAAPPAMLPAADGPGAKCRPAVATAPPARNARHVHRHFGRSVSDLYVVYFNHHLRAERRERDGEWLRGHPSAFAAGCPSSENNLPQARLGQRVTSRPASSGGSSADRRVRTLGPRTRVTPTTRTSNFTSRSPSLSRNVRCPRGGTPQHKLPASAFRAVPPGEGVVGVLILGGGASSVHLSMSLTRTRDSNPPS